MLIDNFRNSVENIAVVRPMKQPSVRQIMFQDVQIASNVRRALIRNDTGRRQI